MNIEKNLNLLSKKLKTHSRIELKELCVLFYINKKETVSLEEIAEKFFYHKDWNSPFYLSALRSIQKIGMGSKYKTPDGKEITMKGAELIDEKKYPNNVIKIDGSDWKNKEYVVTKKGKKLIDEIEEIFKKE
jgi:DNA-binding MarR family transcriptional regulator